MKFCYVWQSGVCFRHGRSTGKEVEETATYTCASDCNEQTILSPKTVSHEVIVNILYNREFKRFTQPMENVNPRRRQESSSDLKTGLSSDNKFKLKQRCTSSLYYCFDR